MRSAIKMPVSLRLVYKLTIVTCRNTIPTELIITIDVLSKIKGCNISCHQKTSA